MALADVPNEPVDSLVVGAISKCWKEEIAPDTLLNILCGEGDVSGWEGHLNLFFSELPLEALLRFVFAHGLKPSQLRGSYENHLAAGGDPNPALEEWLYG